MNLNDKDILDSLIYERDSEIICYMKNKADKAHPITDAERAEWVRRFEDMEEQIQDFLDRFSISIEEAEKTIYSKYGLFIDINAIMEA